MPTNSTIIKPGSKAAQHWNLTQCPFYRSPTSFRCVACARPRHQLDLCRSMPRPCISARSSADCCANYSAQLFHPAEFSNLTGSQPECSATKASISWNTEATRLETSKCCPLVGQTSKSLPSEHYRLRFSPRYTRQPLHEAAN